MRKITLLSNGTQIFTSSAFNYYDEERPLVFDLKDINYVFDGNDFNHVDFELLILKCNSNDQPIMKEVPQMVYVKNVNLEDTRFDNCELTEMYFNNCNFHRSILNAGIFDKCTFLGCNFENVQLPTMTAIECVFSHIDFSNTVIGVGCLFTFCRFEHCQGLERIPADSKQNCVIVD